MEIIMFFSIIFLGFLFCILGYYVGFHRGFISGAKDGIVESERQKQERINLTLNQFGM